MRGSGITQLSQFLTTGSLPKSLGQPIADLKRGGREDLEDQYSVARQQILNESPVRGGQLADQMRDLSVSRARAVGGLETQLKAQLEAPLRSQLFSSALGLGFGQPPVALSGLSGASGNYGQIATRALSEQLSREQAAKDEWQSIGQAAGMAFT